jgi:hypothetical protein
MLLSALLFSGGTMSILMYTGNDFWTSSPLRQHFIPLGHAHAGLLAIVSLLFGLYLDKISLPERAKNLAVVSFIAGTLLMPGGFLISVLRPGLTAPGNEFLMVPIGGVLVGVSFIAMFVGMARTIMAERKAH